MPCHVLSRAVPQPLKKESVLQWLEATCSASACVLPKKVCSTVGTDRPSSSISYVRMWSAHNFYCLTFAKALFGLTARAGRAAQAIAAAFESTTSDVGVAPVAVGNVV